jgi:multiple sugar transport system substrate-binding protein
MKKSNKLAVLLGATAMSLGALALSGCSVKSVDYGYSLDMTADTRGASITFWHGLGGNNKSVIEQMMKDFTALTGITVDDSGSPSGYDALQNAINLSASTGTYPNVALGYPDHFAGYMYSDIQLPLNYLIDNDKNIPAKQSDGSDELAKFDYRDFYASYKTENESLKSDTNGNAYVMGIPFNKSTEVMIYNKTFFNADIVKAYNNGAIKVPVTWDEAETTCKNILAFVKEKAAYGKVLGIDGNTYAKTSDAKTAGTTVLLDLSAVTEGKLHPLTYDSTSNWFITGARQYGGTYTTYDAKAQAGYIGFKNDSVKSFLNEMVGQGRANGFGVAADWGAQYCSDYFKTYQTLMNIGSSAGVSYVIPAVDAETKQPIFEPAVAPIPYKNADKKFVISQGTNMCMFNKGTDVEKLATWKFVKYMTQIANGTFAASTSYFPTCKTAYNSTDYQAMLAKQTTLQERLAVQAAQVNNDSYSSDKGWTKFVDPGFVGSSSIRTSIATVIPEMFIDGKDFDTVMNEQYTALADYVKK